jgi:Leucine-rich repeat (LRR) protein
MRASDFSTGVENSNDSSSTARIALRRRWYQFSLRTLLIVSILFSFAAAWYGHHFIRLKNHRMIVQQLRSQGWEVRYDYQWDGEKMNMKAPPPGSAVFRKIFGDDFNTNIDSIVSITNNLHEEADFTLLEKIPTLRAILIGGELNQTETLQRIFKSAKSVKSATFYFGPFSGTSRMRKASAELIRLASIGEMRNLEELIVNGQGMAFGSEHNNEQFESIRELHWLKKLQLKNTHVTDECLGQFHQLTNLESLDIEGNPITGSCFERLLDLSRLTTLKADSTKLDNIAIRRLVKLAPNLQELSLYSTAIDDAALDEIVKLQKLKSLRLNGTKITDAGIEKLAVLKNLTNLQVGSKISLEAKKALQQKLPKCMINDKIY